MRLHACSTAAAIPEVRTPYVLLLASCYSQLTTSNFLLRASYYSLLLPTTHYYSLQALAAANRLLEACAGEGAHTAPSEVGLYS